MTDPFPEVAEAAARISSAAVIGGVVPAARGALLAGLLRSARVSAPMLVVVPHVHEARELEAGLRLFDPSLRVAAVAADVASPFLGVEPDSAVQRRLAQVLADIGVDALDIVVVPARVLLAKLPSPARIESEAVSVGVGDEIDPLELARDLNILGYRRVDLVENVGEFAVRGAVMDVYGEDRPVRLELDDQRVDRIQPFDAGSQRSAGEPIDGLRLLPADLFPMSEVARRALADVLRNEYPELASEVRLGTERRLWWALASGRAQSFDPLRLEWPLVVCDRDEVVGEIRRWMGVQRREHATLSARTVPLPPPERVLVDPDAIESRLEGAGLRLERLELHDPEHRWGRVGTHPQESFAHRIPDLVPTVRERRALDLAQLLVVATDGEARRFADLLEENEVVPVRRSPRRGEVQIVTEGPEHGFTWDGVVAVYGRRDLTAAPPPEGRPRRAAARFAADLRDLRPGDLVVHVDHGIARFDGFRRVEVEGRAHEVMVLRYRGDDSLLVPVERADLIQRYGSGESEASPQLDRLGGATWRRRKARVRKAVREMAGELLRLAAVRRTIEGHAFSPDSPWQREFEDAFTYDLTLDQERAIVEVKRDMESPRPMDRLLCGDVGYGKTEVAMRAAFKAVLDGRQVAMLAPTTILVEQHYETFRRRMERFPVEIRMLSRFVSAADERSTLVGLADGTVDVAIGTHRLLGGDIRFRDLGLIIIDEEQRFGVAQKERLKRLRTETDVLAMSATPIPRTLNMALGGLRDISLIETPPRDRLAVETKVLELSEDVVREAILHEMEREGQVFFVHNRVRSIGAVARWLKERVPEARIVVGHGQMAEAGLERSMRRFLNGDADVLLASAIIENGLDIPNANTLIVNRADRFGLAQLYQLRGRVGRSARRAFAYLLVPRASSLSRTARERLAAIQEFCDLGAGFRIAARDLEIRGAGNVLGAEQHGFLEAVGFETYAQLLEEAVAELQGQPSAARREVRLQLGLDLQLPESYLPDAGLRLSFYKRLAGCASEDEIEGLLAEIRDRFGPAPEQAANLAFAQRVRVAAREARVTEIVRRGDRLRLRLDTTHGPPDGLKSALAGWPDASVRPSGEIVLPDVSPGAWSVLPFLERLRGSDGL